MKSQMWRGSLSIDLKKLLLQQKRTQAMRGCHLKAPYGNRNMTMQAKCGGQERNTTPTLIRHELKNIPTTI
jgi:hypothetical protein